MDELVVISVADNSEVTATRTQRRERIVHPLPQHEVSLASLILQSTIARELFLGNGNLEIFGHRQQNVAEKIAVQVVRTREVLVEDPFQRRPVSTKDHFWI